MRPAWPLCADPSSFGAMCSRNCCSASASPHLLSVASAAGVHALEHHVDRLAEDHANAQTLAQGLAGIDGLDLDPATVETNMVYFDVAKTGLTGAEFSAALRPYEVRISAMGPTLMRAVTHIDIDRAMINEAIAASAAVAMAAPSRA